MTRAARIVNIGIGLVVSLLPGCTQLRELFAPAQVSVNNPVHQAQTGQNIPMVQGPRWPADLVQETKTPGAASDQAAPDSPKLTYQSGSLLTGPGDFTIRRTAATQQLDRLLGTDPPVLLPPTSAPAAVPTAEAPSPPIPPNAKKAAPAEEPIVLALQSLLRDQPEEALEHLKTYDAANQEALICLTATIARLAKKKLDQLSPTEIAHLQDQVQKCLLTALRPRAELRIETMCFCESIKGYGAYKRLPDDYEFEPTQADRPGDLVQLYVELRNLTSQPRNGAFETVLHSRMKILDTAGQEVLSHDFREQEGPFRTVIPVPDYFEQCYFYVPRLPPGKYVLRFEVQDVTRPETPRNAVKTIEFRVGTANLNHG
jgi:hypothetical protein